MDDTENKIAPRKGGLWKWVKWLVLIGVVLVLIAGAALWLARDWLAAKAVALVDEAMSERGIHLRWDEADYNPLRGLVLTGVALCESEAKKVPLVTVGDLGIKVGIDRLLNERSMDAFEAEISTRDADVAFYSEGKLVLAAAKLDLAATTSATALQLAGADGSIGDLAFSLSGEWLFPPKTDEATKLELDFSALAEVTRWLAFDAEKARPTVTAKFRAAEAAVTVAGDFEGKAFRYRGVRWDAMSMDFAFDSKANAVTVSDASVKYRSGEITASGVGIDLTTQVMTVAGIDSRADVLSLAGEFVPSLKEALASVRMTEPVPFSAHGSIHLGDLTKSDLAIKLPGAGTVAVSTAPEQSLAFGGPKGALALKEGVLKTDGLSAKVWGGEVSWAGAARVFDESPRFDGRFDGRGIALPQLLGDEEAKGALEFVFEGGGTPDLATLSGAGSAKVVGGDFFSVPVVKQMHRLLRGVAPIFGNRREETLTATFKIKDGVVTTDDFLLAGDGTLIHLRGDVDLGRETVDLIAYLTLDGVVGLATGIVTRLVEVRGGGAIADPKLSLNTKPTDLAFNAFSGVVDLGTFGVTTVAGVGIGGAEAVMEVGKKGVGVAAELGKGAAETAVGGVRKVGEGVRDAGKGIIRKVIPGRKDGVEEEE